MSAYENAPADCESVEGAGAAGLAACNSTTAAGKPQRKGRGKAQATIELVTAAARILEEIRPASVRAVCYRLFVAGLIKDMSKKETDRVGGHLVNAREESVIPWEWFVDETREAETVPSWDDPEDIIRSAVRQYRKDYWRDQAVRVELWSEKGTIRSSVKPILDKYGVTLRVMHGYTSATAIQAVASETARNPKPLILLYAGDWDPSGMGMSETDIPARLARYGGQAEITRIALNESDVITGNLPGFNAATKRGDSRYNWFVKNYGNRCWELDALPPPILRARVEKHIRQHINFDLWDHACMVEKAEVDSMREILPRLRGVFPGQPENSLHGGDV